MNNIDKEIDEFKTNLSLIEKVSKEVSNSNDNFSRIIKDCQDLEEIKKSLNDEINNLNTTNKDYVFIIKNLYEKLNEKNEEILKSVNAQNQDIMSLKEQINTLSSNNDKYFKINIGLTIIIIILCLILAFI